MPTRTTDVWPRNWAKRRCELSQESERRKGLFSAACVVGYSNNAITNGYSLSVVQFNTIGQPTSSYKLSDLVPKHSDGSIVEDANGGLSIQTFKTDASTAEAYFWYGPNDDEETYEELGWYDKKDRWAGNVVIGESRGFMVHSPFAAGNLNFQVSGAVVMTQKEAVITNGYSLCGNSCAKAMKLSEITPKHMDGSAVEDANGGLSIQTFKTDASTAEAYFWYGPNDDEETYEELGWYDKKDRWAGDIEIPAGKGFMIHSPFAANQMKLVYDAIK